MQRTTGISCHQLHIASLEDVIAPNNQVRFIDAFVAIQPLLSLPTFRVTLKKNRRFNIARLFEIVRAGYTCLKLLLL